MIRINFHFLHDHLDWNRWPWKEIVSTRHASDVLMEVALSRTHHMLLLMEFFTASITLLSSSWRKAITAMSSRPQTTKELLLLLLHPLLNKLRINQMMNLVPKTRQRSNLNSYEKHSMNSSLCRHFEILSAFIRWKTFSSNWNSCLIVHKLFEFPYFYVLDTNHVIHYIKIFRLLPKYLFPSNLTCAHIKLCLSCVMNLLLTDLSFLNSNFLFKL